MLGAGEAGADEAGHGLGEGESDGGIQFVESADKLHQGIIFADSCAADEAGLAAITEERLPDPSPDDERVRAVRGFQEFFDRLSILRRERDGGMESMLLAMATGYDYRKYQKVKAVERKGSGKS